MWTLTYTFSQVCMIFAVLSLALSYCVKNRVAVLFLSISNAVFYAAHYLLLAEHTAAILNLVGIVRGVWFFINDKLNLPPKKSWVSLAVCLALLLVGGILTYEHWYSFLPLVATIIYTVSVWQENIKTYRWSVIPVETCGISLNIIIKSLFGVLFESALLVTGIVSLARMYYKERRSKVLQGTAKEDESCKFQCPDGEGESFDAKSAAEKSAKSNKL